MTGDDQCFVLVRSWGVWRDLVPTGLRPAWNSVTLLIACRCHYQLSAGGHWVSTAPMADIEEQMRAFPSNCGYWTRFLTLEWVRDIIMAFGGATHKEYHYFRLDRRVTCEGVGALLAMPPGGGDSISEQFTRAVPTTRTMRQRSWEVRARTLLAALGIS